MRFREIVIGTVAALVVCLLLVVSGCNSGENPDSAAREVDLTAVDLPGTEDPELSAIAKQVLDAHGLFHARRLLPDGAWKGHLSSLEAKTSAYHPSAFAYWLLAGTARTLSDVPTDRAGMRALAAVEKAVKLAPESSYAHGLLGEIYCYQGETDKSLRSCNKAVRLAADSLRAQLVIGLSLHKCGRFEDATTHLEKAAAVDPEYSRAQYCLGCAYGELKRYFDAVAKLEEAIKLDPDYLEAYWELGKLHEEKKRWDRAAEAYREVIRIDPERVEPHYALAGAYYEDGKYQEAIRLGRKAVRMDRCCAWARYYTGMSYLKLGKTRRAEIELKKALEYSELRSDLYWLARNALLEINPPSSSGGG